MIKRKGRVITDSKKSLYGTNDNEVRDNRDSADEGNGDVEEDEEDYLDESDVEASARNQDKAFVYVGADGKLIYVPHEDNDEEDRDDESEEFKEVERKNVNFVIRENDEMKDTENVKIPGDNSNNKEEEEDLDSCCTTSTIPPISDDGAHAEVEEDHVRQKQGGCLYTTKEEEQSSSEWPLPRIRHALAVRGNTIYVFGGLLEVREREYTLDDCWALDLRTR